MRVDLPGGEWVELRDPDQLTVEDRLAMREQREVPVSGYDEHTRVSGAMMDRMRIGLLASIITAWSYEAKGWPVPSKHPNPTAMIRQLPLAAYDELTVKIKPHMEAADYYPPENSSGESSGTSGTTPSASE